MKYLLCLLLFSCNGETLYMDDGPSTVSSPATGGSGATPGAINITSPAPITTAEVGDEFYHQVSAFSSTNQTLTYGLQNEPAGMNINSLTGVITWTPISGQTSSGAVLITVTDQNGNREEQVLHLTVDTPTVEPTMPGSPGGSLPGDTSPGDGPPLPPLDPPEEIEDGDELPIGATDWSATDDVGVVTYFNSVEEAQTHGRDGNKPRSRISYKGKPIFARRSLVIPFNPYPKKVGDLVTAIPIYDNLDNAYRDYYKEGGAGAYTQIGPGGRGWHITYAFPLGVKKHHYTKTTDSFYKNRQGVIKSYPFKDEIFVQIALDGKSDFYIHADFVKELILLKDAADLHHFIRQTKSHKPKDGVEKNYDEMAHISLQGDPDEKPDGSETHPTGATPAPFIKKPGNAFLSNYPVAYDLAPDWMEFGKKYYTFDYHYFYEDFVEMGKDIFADSHSRSVNKDTPYINIYNFLNIFKPGAYTIDELYEYINHEIEDTQHYKKSACEISLLSDYLPDYWPTDNVKDSISTCKHIIKPPYTDQKESFRTWQSESGINPAIMLSVAKGESGFGRSQESHEDGDPFNHGGGYSNNCDFCKNPKKCSATLGPTICNDCAAKCPTDFKDQASMTPYVIRMWPLYWKDQVIKGVKKIPAFGFKGGGIAQGYNPSLYWGPHMAAKYYGMDLYLGFCEKKRINKMADPTASEVLVFLNPPAKNNIDLNLIIKDITDLPSYPCPNSY